MAPERYVPITPAEAWKLVEQDFLLRLSLVTREWNTEHLNAVNALASETERRGNAAYYFPARVDLEIEIENRRAEWCVQACCEIWEIQGRTKSRALYRAIFNSCLTPRFSNLGDKILAGIRVLYTRTRKSIFLVESGRAGHLYREIRRLQANWDTKLQIAARDSEHQERAARERDARRLPSGPVRDVDPLLEKESSQVGALSAAKSRSTNLKYHSPTKRAILVALVRGPKSTDLEVWEAIDADGSADLPKSWATPRNDRSFVRAYKESKGVVRSKMHKLTTKVRADMKRNGLM
jgi:hypothetical protein